MNYCTRCGTKQKNNQRFCTNCGKKLLILKHKKNNSIFLLLAGVLSFILIYFYFSQAEDEKSDKMLSTNDKFNKYDQSEIVAPVVNIFCPSDSSGYEVSGGSGTIINEDGLILTNSHVIPQDESGVLTTESGCIVALPNPITGELSELFWAEPIVLHDISEAYDLAFLQIYTAYFDEETQSYAGTYPRKFPAFDDSERCIEESIRLGEAVRVFGYPAISGGYSLTITDGVVSSFPGNGLIVTSAKISHGNSGGLAIDENGCMIGVPSLVSGDEFESLGVIISNDLIFSFIDEVSEKTDNL